MVVWLKGIGIFIREEFLRLLWGDVVYGLEMKAQKNKAAGEIIRAGLVFWYGGRMVKVENDCLVPGKGYFYVDARTLNWFGRMVVPIWWAFYKLRAKWKTWLSKQKRR
jgi:hypothetical protein